MKKQEKICKIKISPYICNPVLEISLRKAWEHSSVGSERLPYTQRVGGSTPSAPTERKSLAA